MKGFYNFDKFLSFMQKFFLGYIMIFLVQYSTLNLHAQEEKHPVDGVAFKTSFFMPEVKITAGNEFSGGAGISYQYGLFSQMHSIRHNIFELVTGFDFQYHPNTLFNIRLGGGYTFGLPFYGGFLFNHYTDLDTKHMQTIEPLLGFSKYIPYYGRIANIKVLAGYHWVLNNKDNLDEFPFSIHLIIGFKKKK